MFIWVLEGPWSNFDYYWVMSCIGKTALHIRKEFVLDTYLGKTIAEIEGDKGWFYKRKWRKQVNGYSKGRMTTDYVSFKPSKKRIIFMITFINLDYLQRFSFGILKRIML